MERLWSPLCDSMGQCNIKAKEGMLITTMIMGQAGPPRNLPQVFIHLKGVETGMEGRGRLCS